MSVNSVDDFMARVRSALLMPTLYWLGYGGWEVEVSPLRPSPGTTIVPTEALERLEAERPAVHQKYVAGFAQKGLTMAQLPGVACDCSAFLWWALQVPRHGDGGGWMTTDEIHADAQHSRRFVVRTGAPRVGDLLVHPRPRQSDPGAIDRGHVAVISAVEGGTYTRMIHCAPENYLIDPPAGQARNAIAETGCELFAENRETLVVAWKAFGA